MTEGLQSAELNARRRFAAFMSYAHADAATASKLQSRLERYRLPKHLAQVHTGGQAALGQIFRDREDLAAAPSLSDAIRAAISEAEALVVICSPDAVASRWVGEEIALFRALHPDRPILAAVVRGAPEEAFPAALTEGGNEPLAADLRKEADGEALGFLKIVAGIAGVPLDALVQRDAQRRIRRVMWITGAAIAAMLIMGVMTTLALSARNEAARQRAEAEGLVEYMLTDLREKLKGVGRLDVMDAVNDRAMGYYTTQGSLNNLPPDSLDRRARLLHAMGEDDEQKGKIPSALAKFQEAHRVTGSALILQPTDPDAIFAHAQSEYWVGYMHFLKRNKIATARNWLAYAELAERMVAIAPDDKRSLKEIAYSQGNLCSLALETPIEVNKALQNCAKALKAEQAWSQKNPKEKGVRLDLANRHAWNAEALSVSGNAKVALVERKKQLALIEQELLFRPNDKDVMFRKAMCELSMSDVWAELADRAKAVAAIDASLVLLKQLVEFDPNNANSKNRLNDALEKKERYENGSN